MRICVCCADVHGALYKVDKWFAAKKDDAPWHLKTDVAAIKQKLLSRMDYGEHQAMYLAAMLNPRCACFCVCGGNECGRI